MIKYSKMKLFENLKDWKHLVGYGLLTTITVVILHLNGIHALHTSSYFPNLLFLEVYVGISLVDSINHKVLLQ